MKKIYFIFNPNSGNGQTQTKLFEIIDIFIKNDCEVTVHPTQSKGDAAEKARLACESGEYNLLVCSGGDGTLSEVISGIMLAQKCLPIGYIPAGTMNDFAWNVGMSKNIIKSAESVMDGQAFLLDVGEFNGKFFSYVAAFGAFTESAYETSQVLKSLFGQAAYVFDGMARISKLQSFVLKIEHDEGIIEDEFAFGMITNSKRVGGILTHEDADLGDGIFECTFIRTPENTAELFALLQVFPKLKNGEEHKMLVNFKSSKLEISSPMDIAWTLDGEFGETTNAAKIFNHTKAVEIIVPAETL